VTQDISALQLENTKRDRQVVNVTNIVREIGQDNALLKQCMLVLESTTESTMVKEIEQETTQLKQSLTVVKNRPTGQSKEGGVDTTFQEVYEIERRRNNIVIFGLKGDDKKQENRKMKQM
jgi:hypothetical protein